MKKTQKRQYKQKQNGLKKKNKDSSLQQNRCNFITSVITKIYEIINQITCASNKKIKLINQFDSFLIKL